ncbi:MAG: GspH/FimT family protein [Defluviitaleaceae bacterium]|nr:GspH/FimT family protein [Defluviitaleaceae bacterium]MCL2262192.1 GspH/FimT family protein [Defluviitaleaceae bacterium]
MKSQSGFTILELTVAVAVLLLAASVIFLGTRVDYRRGLQNAALVLQADMRYAQRRAITEGQRVGIQFCAVHNRYSVITQNPLYHHRFVYFPYGVQIYSYYLLRNRFMYLPRGTIERAGNVILRNGQYTIRITTTVGGGQAVLHPIMSD